MSLSKSEISYCSYQWPITHGCAHRSPGCQNCWSEACDKRFHPEHNFGETVIRIDLLYSPFNVRDECSCFIDCNSDLFYEGEADPSKKGVPDIFIERVIGVVRLCPNIHFLILTKRYQRCLDYFTNHPDIPENLYIGFSVCCDSEVKWLDSLRQIPTEHRWVSFEPLLSDVSMVSDFSLEGIEVAIVGGEQAPGKTARRMEKNWVLGIKQNCDSSGTVFYFKQWGDWSENGEHKNTKKNGHILDGDEYRQLPWPIKNNKK